MVDFSENSGSFDDPQWRVQKSSSPYPLRPSCNPATVRLDDPWSFGPTVICDSRRCKHRVRAKLWFNFLLAFRTMSSRFIWAKVYCKRNWNWGWIDDALPSRPISWQLWYFACPLMFRDQGFERVYSTVQHLLSVTPCSAVFLRLPAKMRCPRVNFESSFYWSIRSWLPNRFSALLASEDTWKPFKL